MKQILMAVVLVALVGIGVAVLFGMTTPPKPEAGRSGAAQGEDTTGGFALQTVSPEEANERWHENPKNVVLIDVRTDEEYENWYIPGAVHVPIESPDFARRVAELVPDKNTEIFLFCRTGRRAVPAGEQLEARGYTRLYNMGGIIDWPFESAGKQIEERVARRPQPSSAN